MAAQIIPSIVQPRPDGYNRVMIKGITLVHAASTDPVFEQLANLLTALGFEPGKGWQDATGRGSAFLAPLGNIELVGGRMPAVPPILIEVSALEDVHTIAAKHGKPSAIETTHWNSRLFTLEMGGLKLGFWQSEDPLHGKTAAVEGDLSASGMKFAIVVARWNAVITDRLLQGAFDAILRSGGTKENITVVRVPGAWEIPSAARTLAETKKHDAVITLGCLLRGETAHYEAIYTEVARGIGQSQQETGVPHAFGVLTCETLEQALDRAGVKAGNKGFEAAVAAIEMVSIQKKLKDKAGKS
jgi:6,7-dimethyl-8-ribityllumazine synthase